MSEIASCSYEARAKGIKNGMFMGGALKLCPELQTIPYDFESYQTVAKILYDTVAQYTLDIQAVSCDEMLVDLSDIIKNCSISPEAFAQVLREQIRDKTDCNASVGIGSSILLARMATRKAKPDGIFHLQDDQAGEFFQDVNVADLPGITFIEFFEYRLFQFLIFQSFNFFVFRFFLFKFSILTTFQFIIFQVLDELIVINSKLWEL